MRSVCWFRNDLRVEDNPALYNACLASKSVIGIFIVTQFQWKEHDDAKVKSFSRNPGKEIKSFPKNRTSFS